MAFSKSARRAGRGGSGGLELRHRGNPLSDRKAMNVGDSIKRRQWLCWAAVAPFVSAAWATAARVGAPAPAFNVPDTKGKERSLREFKDKIVVLEWTSPSCPFAAAQYVSGSMPQLQRWARERGIVWLMILSSHPSREDYLPAA